MRIGLGVDVFSAAQPQKTAEDAENQTVNLENPISAISVPREAQTANLEDPLNATSVPREAEGSGRVGLIEPFLIKYEPVLEDFPSMTYYHPSQSGAQKSLPLLEGKYTQAPK